MTESASNLGRKPVEPDELLRDVERYLRMLLAENLPKWGGVPIPRGARLGFNDVYAGVRDLAAQFEADRLSESEPID